MNILSLASGLVSIFKTFADWFSRKQLIDAGKDKAKNEQLEAQQGPLLVFSILAIDLILP